MIIQMIIQTLKHQPETDINPDTILSATLPRWVGIIAVTAIFAYCIYAKMH